MVLQILAVIIPKTLRTTNTKIVNVGHVYTNNGRGHGDVTNRVGGVRGMSSTESVRSTLTGVL